LASRKEQRDQARAEREKKAAEEAAKQKRKKRLLQIGGALLAVVAIVVIVVVSSSGGSKKGSAKGDAIGSKQAAKLLGGIPQSNLTLGSPNAKVTVNEYADLQCPFCRDYTEKIFPTIVAKYVRTGKVKMVFHNYAFIGADSVTAARAAVAAGAQNKLWNFADVWYANQGTENSGYVTDKFIEKIASGVPGLDAKKVLQDRLDPKIDQTIAEAQQSAQQNGVNSTPSFILEVKGRPARKLPGTVNTDASAFSAELDKALGAGT
jgi:protein-disulfide isomerase